MRGFEHWRISVKVTKIQEVSKIFPLNNNKKNVMSVYKPPFINTYLFSHKMNNTN